MYVKGVPQPSKAGGFFYTRQAPNKGKLEEETFMKKAAAIKVISSIVTTVCLGVGVIAVGASVNNQATETTIVNVEEVAAKSGNSVLQIEATFGTKQIEAVQASAQAIKTEKEEAKAAEEAKAKEEAAKTSNNTTVTAKKNTATATNAAAPATENSLVAKAEAQVAASGGGIGRVVALTNLERAKAGLGSLRLDGTLSAMAQVRAQEIVSTWSHTRPDGTNVTALAKQYGLSYAVIGENLGKGQKSADAVVNAWMNSSSHRAQIMGGYSRIGVAIYSAGGKTYWVQLFAN
jgi:uncharacterized protein YkwD